MEDKEFRKQDSLHLPDETDDGHSDAEATENEYLTESFINELWKDIERDAGETVRFDDKDEEEEGKSEITELPKISITQKNGQPVKKSATKKKPPKPVEPLPECPVCHELLDGKTKRVFSKPISTDVYFPFLDNEDNVLPAYGHMPKVKICYPCYEHLIMQWKEYKAAGVPHRRRKYRDRNGKFVINYGPVSIQGNKVKARN